MTCMLFRYFASHIWTLTFTIGGFVVAALLTPSL